MDQLVLKESEKGKTQLVIKNDNVIFNSSEITDYINRFEKLKELGKISVNTNFNDITWIACYKNGKIRNINFKVNKLILNNVLKCLVIIKLEQGIRPYTLPPLINALQEVLILTKCFSKDKVEDLEDFFYKKPKNTVRRAYLIIDNFLSFYPISNIDDYEDILDKNVALSNSNVRKLPNYKSILTFDYIINKTILERQNNDLLKYYPLFLWWKITSIIPLRPSEFLEIEFDCCWKDVKDRYWIKIPREKIKETTAKRRIERVDILETTSDIYGFIEEYKSLLKPEFRSHYLISWKAFNSFCVTPDNNLNNKLDQEIMCLSSISHLFNNFYKCKITDTDIVPLKPGDSRHLAFCNMILQGFNPIAIARIGGHVNLESQLHYYNHLETYAESYVYTMSRKLKIENHLNTRNASGKYDAIKRTGLLCTYSLDQIRGFLEIEKGYCTIKSKDCNDFFNCVTECWSCLYHILDVDRYPEVQKELHEKSDNLTKIIKEQIDLLKNISKNMFIDLAIEKSSVGKNSKIKSTAEQLQNLMAQKIVIDSKLLDYVKEENSVGK